MKKAKKIMIVVLALVMIFACAVTVFGLTDLNSLHVQDSFATASQSPSSMTVYLSILSDGKNNVYIDRDYFPVYMSSTDYSNADGICRVGDVLRKAATTYSWLNFYTTDNNGNIVLSVGGPTNYVYGISDSTVDNGNTVFEASNNPLTRRGWMFRINRKFQLLDEDDYPRDQNGNLVYDPDISGPISASIETAIVEAGDKIDLYYADAYSYSTCTRKLYIEPISNNSDYGIRVYRSYSYFGPVSDDSYWYVDTQSKTATSHNYALLKNTYLYVQVDNGTPTLMQTNNKGIIIIQSLAANSGQHTVKVYPQFNTGVTINGNTCQMPYYTSMSIDFTL